MNFLNMPMADIKKTVEALDETRWAEAADFLKDDQRKGARNIGKALERKLANMALERSRINEMKKIEERYRDDGIEIIAGIDEVGRGPLAGPVVSCAIILPPECDLLHINDSKKISEEKRKYLFEQSMQWHWKS
jgi:ribonuclease HII